MAPVGIQKSFIDRLGIADTLRRIRPGPLALLMLGVLLAHALVLSWLRNQLEDLKPLTLMADPMFTRMIVPVRTVAPVPAAKPVARRAAKTARAKPVDVTPAAQAVQEEPTDPQGQDAANRSGDAPEDTTAQAEVSEAPVAAASAPVAEEPPPDTWPVDTRLSYLLTGYYRGEVSGDARVQWQRQQNRYQVRVAMLGLASMTSQGEVTPTGLIPQAYQEELFGFVRRVAFEGGQVKFNDGDLREAPEAVQDSASQLVELSHRFSTGREILKVGAQVKIWLARPRGMDEWTYDVTGEEMLKTPLYGTVQTFRLQPRPIARPRGPIKAEIWFAPSLQYLPVRVRISGARDSFLDLMVERIDQSAPPVPDASAAARLATSPESSPP
jgi:hypothetical protein